MTEKSLKNLEKGKRFSKDRQPKKRARGPQFKRVLQKQIEGNMREMIEAMIEQCKKGNVMAFDKLLDRAYGKVTDKLKTTNKNLNATVSDQEEISKLADDILND